MRTGAQVVRIARERGRVVGVELAGGERIGARRVIANVMPRALLRLAGGALGGRYARGARALPARAGDAEGRLGARRPDSLGVADRPRGRDRPRRRRRPPRCWRRTTLTGGAARAAVPAPRPAVAGRPVAGPGGQAHGLGLHPRPARASTGRRERERHVERVEAQVERFAPGLSRPDPRPPRARARATRAPQREPRRRRRRRRAATRSTRSSSAPSRRCRPYHTPLRGLYLTGAATFPGGAAHGVPGHAAAGLALAEDRLRRVAFPGC